MSNRQCRISVAGAQTSLKSIGRLIADLAIGSLGSGRVQIFGKFSDFLDPIGSGLSGPSGLKSGPFRFESKRRV